MSEKFDVDCKFGHTYCGLKARHIYSGLFGMYKHVFAVMDTALYKEFVVVVNDRGEDPGRIRVYNAEPEKKTKWLNIYNGRLSAFFHEDKHSADRAASRDRIACIKIEYYDGQGLDE